MMFKHILIPTDGSSRSVAAIDRAVRFAKEQGARVTGIYVAPPEQRHILEDMASMHAQLPGAASAAARRAGRKPLREVSRTASELGVPCDVVCAVNERPYEEIVRTAHRAKCDLIYMASHGRTGLSRLLLGSQTSKVLALSKVPVMVIR
jgi:nucleotide-binding universal stress UspA family protein